MRDDMPSVYLLAGSAGPAKSAYVQVLVDHGVVQLPPAAPAQTAAALVEHLRAGRDALIDHDLTDESERERCKALVEEHGGQWCLINFSVDHGPLTSLLDRPEMAVE